MCLFYILVEVDTRGLVFLNKLVLIRLIANKTLANKLKIISRNYCLLTIITYYLVPTRVFYTIVFLFI